MYWTTLEISAPRCALMCYPSSNITYCIACLLCIGVILLNKFNSIQFISPILEIIFNKSLQTGQVPNDWKEANVAPIFKKGDKHNPSNYRPISLTCIISKCMEHILVSNIMQHLDSNKILYALQHGFRENLSCDTQLLSLFQDLSSNPSQTKQERSSFVFNRVHLIRSNKTILKQAQYHSNSYFPRTIRLWNSLPGTVQASPSLAIFATRLAAVPLKYRYSH